MASGTDHRQDDLPQRCPIPIADVGEVLLVDAAVAVCIKERDILGVVRANFAMRINVASQVCRISVVNFPTAVEVARQRVQVYAPFNRARAGSDMAGRLQVVCASGQPINVDGACNLRA